MGFRWIARTRVGVKNGLISRLEKGGERGNSRVRTKVGKILCQPKFGPIGRGKGFFTRVPKVVWGENAWFNAALNGFQKVLIGYMGNWCSQYWVGNFCGETLCFLRAVAAKKFFLTNEFWERGLIEITHLKVPVKKGVER